MQYGMQVLKVVERHDRRVVLMGFPLVALSGRVMVTGVMWVRPALHQHLCWVCGDRVGPCKEGLWANDVVYHRAVSAEGVDWALCLLGNLGLAHRGCS
jgi:hypothetical protein